jgi:DNA-directed RNA polymerase sigma subunit (sigma70/sigma32)
MSDEQTGEISEEQRQVIFKALVEAQDGGMGVAASRAEMARRFAVTEDQVRDIEREGSAKLWPPLDS